MIPPPGVIPIRDLTTRQILYGARKTAFRYELLEHNTTTGADALVGYLDGVRADGSLEWSAAASVKKRGTLSVLDLEAAASGRIRIADVDINTTRIRPVRVVEGLPEVPLGVYVVTASPEKWTGTGRAFAVEMHDKSTVLEQDAVEETFTAAAGVPVLSIVQTVVEAAGERISVDGSDTRSLSEPISFPAATSRLAIVNKLLKALAYNALWVDGFGSFRTTPYVRPAERSIRYSALNDEEGQRLVRELTDGAQSIYSPDWARDRDTYKVPNKVIAIAATTGDTEPLIGVATNEDPNSPFSYQRRGNRWVVPPNAILRGVEVPDYSSEPDPEAATIAFLEATARRSLIAQTSVQATVSLKCLPIPVELLDAIRFASTPAGIDGRHTIQTARIPLRFDGVMALDLQEVVDL